MRDVETNSSLPADLDWAQIERTLQASIRLMKRGRREMERMRRKPGRQEQAGHGQAR